MSRPRVSGRHIYRTRDCGRTWRNVVAGIPEGAYVNSAREDSQAKELLYAATELRVYVSFNDGARWEPLQNNMPIPRCATSWCTATVWRSRWTRWAHFGRSGLKARKT